MLRKYTKDVLERYKVVLVNELKRQLRNKPQPTTVSNGSRLENSISTKSISNGDLEGISVLMNSYGLNVNRGRSGGKGAPPYKLDDWVRRNSSQLRLKDTKPSTIKRVGYLINRSIKRKGIRPTRFIDIAIGKVEPKLTSDLINAFLRDLNEMLDKKIPKTKKS
tara:strand:- start:3601 stop:4092 length:492 start_codon:yes stop_codon:yes gene_type:complete